MCMKTVKKLWRCLPFYLKLKTKLYLENVRVKVELFKAKIRTNETHMIWLEYYRDHRLYRLLNYHFSLIHWFASEI